MKILIFCDSLYLHKTILHTYIDTFSVYRYVYRTLRCLQLL